MIKLNNVSKTYQAGSVAVDALRGVNLGVEKGEFAAVIGPSGSGKSTLLNILGCLDTPTEGSYEFEGVKIEGLDDDRLAEIRNAKIGFVFQDFHLLPRYSALKNVQVPLVYSRSANREGLRMAEKALDRVSLSHRLHHRPNQLSGGEKQRVAIARALVNEPALILADEPTGNLDSKTGEEILAILIELNKTLGTTVLLITHDLSVARRARRTIELKDGRITTDK